MIETHPFEPWLPSNAKLLMLGTFPPASKRWCFEWYYPNFQNDMWRIFGYLFFADKMHFVDVENKTFRLDLIKSFLAEKGIASHYIQELSETEQSVKRVNMFPLEVVVRNVAAGSFAKRFGMEEGIDLPFPVLEFYYKDDALNDPFINDAHVQVLGAATEEEVVEIKKQALKINAALIEMFKAIGIRLIDFKIEFGKTAEGEIILADEISPDTCRLWDLETNEQLDKDIYRRDLGDLIPVYVEVLDRLNKM